MKQRIITATLLIGFILVILFLLPALTPLFIALVFGLSLWEWVRITKQSSANALLTVISTLALLYAGLCYQWIFGLLLLTTAIHYAFSIRLIQQFESIINYRLSPCYLQLIAPVLLATTTVVLLRLTAQYPDSHIAASTIVFMVAVVAATDSGAYFAGRFFGKEKFSPKVSPNKTIEGALGGIASGVIIGLLLLPLINSHQIAWWLVIIALIATALASILGDLFISLIKRQNAIKDTSNLLPGHGGILDRIDGLLAGIPVFYLIAL
ncbi:phosphatidate cytidylyltransferase [Ostreibacterium oceani]|uniref:Phosphatidate cytidylyltransferase n=1 Tax=Ostreibacterium oceani TaxID=2654998 RepID=A0A6N7EYK2_9GAMM|nr:phosphatidate cytidylyltransferase [Ostreibacterium oceani]MPV85558.1 hypothetical protein [Ostreibacterium oceani]